MSHQELTRALAQKILEIVDLDAPRSDVQGVAEALADRIAYALDHEGDRRDLLAELELSAN